MAATVAKIRMQLASLLLATLLVAGLINNAQGHYTVKNESHKDIVIVAIVDVDAVVDVDVEILVAVGAVVELPDSHRHCTVRNLGNKAESAPIHIDASVIVIVDGLVDGTVDLQVGVLSLDGLLHIVADADIIVRV